MTDRVILASGSEIRQSLLRNAGVEFDTVIARIDEDMIKQALIADGAPPRDIADALAEAKARKVSQKHPDAFVIGSDQVLNFNGELLSKPADPADATRQLTALSGQGHRLISAAVIYQDAKPVWRAVTTVRMHMRVLSPGYIDAYVARAFRFHLITPDAVANVVPIARDIGVNISR